MQSHLKKIGARIYLYEKDAVQKVTYVYEDGTEGEPLPDSSILVCLQTPSCSERSVKSDFFVYPFSLRLYDTDVDSLNLSTVQIAP